jgi:hypothetical protein
MGSTSKARPATGNGPAIQLLDRGRVGRGRDWLGAQAVLCSRRDGLYSPSPRLNSSPVDSNVVRFAGKSSRPIASFQRQYASSRRRGVSTTPSRHNQEC